MSRLDEIEQELARLHEELHALREVPDPPKRTRYFLDTEFLIDQREINPISIGIISENGREFYAVVNDLLILRRCLAHSWQGMVTEVLDQLPVMITPSEVRWNRAHPEFAAVMSAEQVEQALRTYLDPSKYGKPELWAYYGADDWNCLRLLLGGLDWSESLLNTYPHHFNEIKQLLNEVGNPRWDQLLHVADREHHALHDARMARRIYWYAQALTYHLTTTDHPPHIGSFLLCEDEVCVQRKQRLELRIGV